MSHKIYKNTEHRNRVQKWQKATNIWTQRASASTATWEVTAEAQRETKRGQGNKTTRCREPLLTDVLWCKTMTWIYGDDLIACHRVPICLCVKAEDAFITARDVFRPSNFTRLCCSDLAFTLFKHHVLNLRKLRLQSSFTYNSAKMRAFKIKSNRNKKQQIW